MEVKKSHCEIKINLAERETVKKILEALLENNVQQINSTDLEIETNGNIQPAVTS